MKPNRNLMMPLEFNCNIFDLLLKIHQKMLLNAHLLAKIGFDTAENDPPQFGKRFTII